MRTFYRFLCRLCLALVCLSPLTTSAYIGGKVVNTGAATAYVHLRNTHMGTFYGDPAAIAPAGFSTADWDSDGGQTVSSFTAGGWTIEAYVYSTSAAFNAATYANPGGIYHFTMTPCNSPNYANCSYNVDVAGGGSTVPRAITCVQWENKGVTAAILEFLQLDSAGNAFGHSDLSAVYVRPGMTFSQCITNIGLSPGSNSWCGGSSGWVLGDTRPHKTVADTSGTWTCDTTPAPATNRVSGVTNTLGSVWNNATNIANLTTNTGNATSQDINRLANITSAAGAAAADAIRDAAKAAKDQADKQGPYPTNMNVGNWPTNYPDSAMVEANYNLRVVQTNTLYTAAYLTNLYWIKTNTLVAATNTGFLPQIATNLLALGTNIDNLSTNFGTNIGGVYTNTRSITGAITGTFAFGTNTLYGATNGQGWALANGDNTSLMDTNGGNLNNASSALTGVEDQLAYVRNRDALGGFIPSATWGLVSIGNNMFIDLKAAISLAIFEDWDAGLVDATGTQLNSSAGVSNVRAVMRLMILWGLYITAICFLVHDMTTGVVKITQVPQQQRGVYLFMGNTILGAGVAEHNIRSLIIVAIILTIPSALIVLAETWFAYTAGSISDVLFIISTGGMRTAAALVPEVGVVWHLVNYWFPVTEFLIICLNTVAAWVFINIAIMKAAVAVKCA